MEMVSAAKLVNVRDCGRNEMLEHRIDRYHRTKCWNTELTDTADTTENIGTPN